MVGSCLNHARGRRPVCSQSAIWVGNDAQNAQNGPVEGVLRVLRGCATVVGMTESATERWTARMLQGTLEAVELLDPGVDAASPNCPSCCMPLTITGTVAAPRWDCSPCGDQTD